MDLYKKHSPEEFFNWLAKGKVLEVRFLSDYHGKKFNNWDLIETLATTFNLEKRFNSLFISTYKQLIDILLYRINGYPLTRIYNIFISVNPKRKVFTKSNSGILHKTYYGGIAGTSHVQTILCDIEHIGERESNATEVMLEECIQGAKYLVKLLQLEDYWINISGNGVHLWIAMNPAIELPTVSFREVTVKTKPAVKYNLKEEPINTFIKNYNRFIEILNKALKEFNPNLKVDEGAKDIARIARPVGSWNVKAGKTARAVGTVVQENKINIYINQKYAAAKPIFNQEARKYKEIKSHSSNHRYNLLNIRDIPLYKLMVNQLLPSTLSRNHYLEQSFARLLRDNDIPLDAVSEVIAEIDAVQQKAIQVDPDYLDDEEPFNAETVNHYCYACKLDFIYDIMEEIPDIADGFITDEHYKSLNSYGDKTIEKMSLHIKEKPNSYFELKCLIRNLIDLHERSIVFFSLKELSKNDWPYLDKNKVILKIMNKTRRRVK